MTNEAAKQLTNREILVKEFNANPDEFLYQYNCKVVNYYGCSRCVVRNMSECSTRCKEAYKEWLDEESEEEENDKL